MGKGIEVKLVGGNSGQGLHEQEIHVKQGPKQGKLVAGAIVYTEILRDYDTQIIPFFNPTKGIAMNINAAFGGTPDIVHVGTTDGVYWTGSNITGGKASFDSGDQAFAGVVSVKVNNPNLNDVWQFDKGSSIDLSNYIALTFHIYIDKDWDNTDNITVYGFDTGTGLTVGNTVNIKDYVDHLDFDIWQKAIIPLSDMGLSSSTIDAFRMSLQAEGAGKAPKIYLDNIQVEETGTSEEYSLLIPKDSVFHIDTLRFQIGGPLTGDFPNNLSYNKILGLTSLANGINLKRVQRGETQFSILLRNLSDMFEAGADMKNGISDTTNTHITLEVKLNNELFVVEGNKGDSITITINDDLSSLLKFTVFAIGRIEI